MIDCPACAGPAEVRQGCETCHGKMKVTQGVFDAFMAKKAKQDEMFEFWNQVQSHMYRSGVFKFEANGEVFELNQEQVPELSEATLED
jgi:(p)ppGpp synthase/HD superfamily hydrolase